jgi:acetyltransferase
VTQGFSDSDDEEGKLLHKEILELANSSDLRILGPNSFGSANAYCGFGSSFGKLNLQKNGVGLICQSGGLFNGVAELCFAGKAIDVGNICNVDFSDCLEYFENDPETKVVVLHIEGMPDTSRFLSIAKRVTRRKPVIAIKTGKSQQAVKAAQSHTGSLAGNNEIWAAALAQSGIITVDSFEELVDMARVFSRLPVIKKPDICVATFSGGTAIMALDGFKNSKLFAGELSEKTKSAIRKFAPSWLPIGNPVDYWPMVMGSPNLIQSMKDIFDILLADEQFGGLFIIQIVNDAFMVELIGRLVQTVVDEHPNKPVVAALVGPGGLDCVKWLQNNGKALAFTSPERAARALARRYDYSQYT